MRARYSIILFIFLSSCTYNTEWNETPKIPENSKISLTTLADSLGTLTISLPTRYDTTSNWTHYSDCGKSCNKIKYRYQPKLLRITKESGWVWLGEPKDSIDRFTISHSGYYPFHDNEDTSSINLIHFNKKAEMIQDPDTYQIKFDTVEQIGDRGFSIIVVDLFDTTKKQISKKVIGTTTIKSNIIEMKFELLSKQNDSLATKFIDESLQYLRTARLSNGR